MSRSFPALFLLVAALGVACGNRIGDDCTDSRDCSTEGDRICDRSSPGGYCTQPGCDFDTCPEESVCVRFFPVAQLDKACVDQGDCTLDEICTTSGVCAPRSTESRFCMLTCEDQGDCRDRYECRTMERIRAHGGEPVPDPAENTSQPVQAFCAPARGCAGDADCDFGDSCVLGSGNNYCQPE